MKFKKNILFTLGSFILLTVIAIPASAGSFSIGYSSGGHNSHHYNYGHNYSSKYYNYGYGHRKSYRYKRYNYPYYQPKAHHSYNNYNNHSFYTKPCHQVSKTVVNDYGEYHKIGGTMCYDSYGQGYVVPGSRYQIR